MEVKSGKPIIVVTGSAGLIGTRVVKAFSSNFNVVGLDLKAPEKDVEGTDFIECDLTKDESVLRALDTVRERHGDHLASVIHLAAYYDFSGKPSDMYRKLTVEGSFRLLKKLREFQTEQFIFSSSLLVMEPAEEEDEKITEFSPLEDEPWDYPRSKIEAEQTIRQERGQIPTVILRIAGVYDEDCHSIPIAQHISRIFEKKFESYFFPGDKDHGQAFVHLDDLIACLQRVVELRSKLKNEIFLIAEPEVISYAEMQDLLGELIHGKEWTTIRIPKVMAKAGAWVQEKIAGEEETFIKPWMVDLADAHYPIAIGHAVEKLGWEPTHRLSHTLPEMINRLKQDPRKWYEMNGLTWPEDEENSKASSQASSSIEQG
jgi:nucleoside-diphosphate-sugar epimerase